MHVAPDKVRCCCFLLFFYGCVCVCVCVCGGGGGGGGGEFNQKWERPGLRVQPKSVDFILISPP